MMSVSSVPTTQSKLVTATATLPLVGTAVRVTAAAGIARVVLEQTFENRHAEPLAVTYTLPLPADAAVSGYSFRVGERTIVGEVDRKRAARERYEQAIASGQTAAILDQERSALFTQELGNIPPGATVICEIVLDQKLRWLDEGAWEMRFPLAAAPRYLGQPGRIADADKLALDVATTIAPRASLFMTIADALTAGRSPESPSHPLQCMPEKGGFSVQLGSGNRVELDRDVVVRWPVASLTTALAVRAEQGKDKAHALFTLVPPQAAAQTVAVPRDLIVLLDTSGSMGGAPLDQARRVAMALLDGLGERDSMDLIEFSDAARRMWKEPIWATKANKEHAYAWLAKIQAGGCTEMREGILEALRPLRADSQRQVILITDGQIGFEQEIVETITRQLPNGARVHTVGVGSAVNRALTGPAARAGRGIEVVIGLGEDPERAAARLKVRTESPLVVDVTLSGDALVAVAPAQIPDLYAGAPVLVAAQVKATGGDVVVRGRTAQGIWEQRVRVAPGEGAGPIAALFAREAVEDAETKLAAGGERIALERTIEAFGIEYQISTRLTSWVAIDKTPSVDPLAPTRKEVVPQMLPYGMSAEGLGLRAAAPAMAMGMAMPMSLGTVAGGYGGSAPGAPPAMGAPPPPPRAAAPMFSVRRSEISAPEDRADEEEHSMVPSPEQAKEKKSESRSSPAKSAPPAPVQAPATRGRYYAPPLLPAKIVHRSGRELTIEIRVAANLNWDPTELRSLVLADGSAVTAKVDFTKTTRAASLTAGQVVRLVLVLDVDTPLAPTQMLFAHFGFALT